MTHVNGAPTPGSDLPEDIQSALQRLTQEDRLNASERRELIKSVFACVALIRLRDPSSPLDADQILGLIGVEPEEIESATRKVRFGKRGGDTLTPINRINVDIDALSRSISRLDRTANGAIRKMSSGGTDAQVIWEGLTASVNDTCSTLMWRSAADSPFGVFEEAINAADVRPKSQKQNLIKVAKDLEHELALLSLDGVATTLHALQEREHTAPGTFPPIACNAIQSGIRGIENVRQALANGGRLSLVQNSEIKTASTNIKGQDPAVAVPIRALNNIVKYLDTRSMIQLPKTGNTGTVGYAASRRYPRRH